MKKVLIIFLFLLIIPLSFQRVYADFGPKPAVEVTIKGIDVPYSVELLIEPDYGFNSEGDDIPYYKDTYPDVFKTYEDNDGFGPYSLYDGRGIISQVDDHTYTINYYGPRTFKVAIALDNDILIVSEIIHTVFYESAVTYDLTDVSLTESQSEVGTVSGDIEGSFPYFKLGFNYLYRLIITLIIEIGLLYIFMYRKKHSYQLVLGVNVATQAVLTGLIIYGYYFAGGVFGAILFLFLGEAIVIMLEAILYALYLKEHSRWWAILYAIVANAATFILSLFFIALF